jgi:hypothetical protein
VGSSEDVDASLKHSGTIVGFSGAGAVGSIVGINGVPDVEVDGQPSGTETIVLAQLTHENLVK